MGKKPSDPDYGMKINRLVLRHHLIKGFSRLLNALADALFPVRCQACRRFYRPCGPEAGAPDPALIDQPPDAGVWSGNRDPHGRTVEAFFAQVMTAWLCPDCRRHFQPAIAAGCACCGDVFESRHAATRLCADCLQRPKHFSRARACGIYAGALKELIRAFKYAGKRQLAGPLGLLLLDGYQRHGFDGEIDLLVPVPLHQRRLRQRGFNQSLLPLDLWPALARRHNRRFAGRLAPGVIERRRATVPQASSGRTQRAANIKNAFRTVAPSQIRDRRILVIDDVYTTGATVNECARVLMRAGARDVAVLTLARAVQG